MLCVLPGEWIDRRNSSRPAGMGIGWSTSR